MKRLLFILFVVVGWKPLPVRGQVDIITTIAGVDTQGYCCDGEMATMAKLAYPESLWLDKYNNIYIADCFNHRIRKIENATGIITTIAGSGVGGFRGDDSLAINAELFLPEAVIVDSNGNVYIADAGNHRIRKIDVSTGIITTIAGSGATGVSAGGDSGDDGPATDAFLNGPSGLCFDQSGSILFADNRNSKIRKLDVTTGIITTVAGTGAYGYSGDHGLAVNAKLNKPAQVCVDSSGNIIFTDTYNNVVRRINIATGIITTIAGNGTVGYFGDNGPALHAEFYLPMGVFVDQQQNIFIADDGNNAVRRIDAATGIITTVAGTGVAGYSGDNGPATNAQVVPADVFLTSNGDMYIADAGTNCIRKVFNPAEGVKQPRNETSFKAYPNPNTGRFTIQTSVRRQYTITVCNIVGEKVYQGEFSGGFCEVDLSDEACGVYFVYLMSGEERVVEKLVVER